MSSEVKRFRPSEKVARQLLGASAVLGACIGAGAGILDAMDISLPPLALSLLGAAVLAFMAWATVAYWRHVDEAAREAHKFAWFWGGSGSLLLIPPIAPLMSSALLESLFGPHTPFEWALGGVVAVLTWQTVGYGLAWCGWWLVRRR
jgi:threonine/homoserine/homoserine lactone efflux protein